MAASPPRKARRTILLAVALTTAWFVAVRCGESGSTPYTGTPCEGVICEDNRECTQDVCDPETGFCHFVGMEDGTPCSIGICVAQVCEPVGSVLPCNELGIRAAIEVGEGPFTFSCDGPTTVTTKAEILIDNDVVLHGGGNLTIDGNDEHRVLRLAPGVEAELDGLTITGGLPIGDHHSMRSAGGIWNEGGTLTLTNSTVCGNEAGIGGGIVNSFASRMTLVNCTVANNTAELGGGIFNVGELTVIHSTLTANVARSGAALSLGAPVALFGTIIDGNCEGDMSFLTSDGYNVESPGDTCGLLLPTDQYDVSAEDLDLGPLTDNGGPTETCAPGSASVTVDMIPEDQCETETDQRGVLRPQGGGCDIGAVEMVPFPGE